MARKSTPVRVTGGAGFTYEDYVAAYFMAEMLAGRYPLGSQFGSVATLHFQVAESGWLLDDLLVGMKAEGKECSFAISIKSDRQVTQGGFPRDFVTAVWQQWLGVHSPCFKSGCDLLGLVTGRLADSVNDAWNDILSQAINGNPTRVAHRLSTPGQTSQLKRDLFASLHCPPDLQHFGNTDSAATVDLVKQIRLLRLDLEREPSNDEGRAISLCQSVLESGSPTEATELWGCLKSLAADHRRVGGSIDLPKVVRKLCPRFRLKTYPDYRRDWSQLSRAASEAMEFVRSTVGGRVSLVRRELLEKLREKLKSNRVLTLIGESGCGKSSLAKQLVTNTQSFELVIWINREMLDQPDLTQVERSLGLQHNFAELMKSVTSSKAVVVFDAVDRFTPRALMCATRLLSLLDLRDDNCQWRVILTSQAERWQEILPHLFAQRVPREFFAQHVVDIPSLSEIRGVLSSFPALQPFTLRSELQPLLRNLKILDWVTTSSISDQQIDIQRWIGLSDLIDWVWERWVTQGNDRHAQAGVLMQLGKTETVTLARGVAVTELTVPEQQILGNLEDSGLVRVKNERVYFTHDLLGDWARLKILLSEQGNLPASLKAKARSIRWHRAIRLYGQRLLEQGGADPLPWYAAITMFPGDSNEEVLVRDLLLESVIFAANANILLDKLWTNLCANNGLLLKRLLQRFLHVATVPDPRIALLAEDGVDASQLAAFMRVPYWPYWGPVLSALRDHLEGIPFGAHDLVPEVCRMWLEIMPIEVRPGHSWPWRHEAAEIAITIAREVQARKVEGFCFHDKADEKAYLAVLYAAHELPAEVAQLALELCRRREPAAEIQTRAKLVTEQRAKAIEEELKKNPELTKRQRSFSIGPTAGPLREPWPDGPSERVDNGFQKVCLQTQALTRLIEVHPEAACEVLLALCIEEPKPDSPFGDYELLCEHLGTEEIPELIPPMYFCGPFLQFLTLQPEHGLDTILRLVNFATHRWVEAQQKFSGYSGEPARDKESYAVTVPLTDAPVKWLGDNRVYGWHRNVLISANTVVCALMALEKWLYDEVNAGRDIGKWIDKILTDSESTAFAAVLIALGKKEHSLLHGELLPLLGIWQIYHWDHYLLQNSDLWQMEMMLWARSDERVYNLVRDWHMLPHRRESLQQLAVYYLLTNRTVVEFFERMRKTWAKEMSTLHDPETLELLIARFDPANYKAAEGSNGKIYIGLEWPEQLRERTESSLRQSQQAMDLLTFPFKCRQLLDGETSLDPKDIEGFWNDLRRLAELDTREDPGLSEIRAEDTICGGVAVLFVLHRDWLRKDKDREKWCIERLMSIVSSPPPADKLGVPESVGTTRWDCFLAECAVALLSEDPSDKSVRQLVAECVTGYYYNTTALAMRASFRLRHRLKSDFGRMQNLVLKWAALRCIRRRAEFLRTDLKRWSKRYKRLIAAFVNGDIPSVMLPWPRIAGSARQALDRLERNHRTPWSAVRSDSKTKMEAEEPVLEEAKADAAARLRGRRRRRIEYPSLDTQLLEHAFDWIPRLEKAQDAAERAAWIALLKELLAVTISTVATSDEDDYDELSGTPSRYDRWIFQRIAQLVPQMTAKEQPEMLWKPILDLGSVAHYWVENFLRDWIFYGTEVAQTPTRFVECWRPMIEYALASPKWAEHAERSFHLDDMYVELMGVGMASQKIGGEEFAKPIGSLVALYEQWVQTWLRRWTVMRSFAVFLTKPAAREIVCPAVQWILKAVNDYSSYGWRSVRTGELESLIAEVLWTCWLQHRPRFDGDPQLRQAFLDLLTILANRQSPSALQLRDEVLRSLGT